MKRTIFILAGAMLCASAWCGDADSEFKNFMKAMLPKVEKAFLKGDIKFFEDISTADFTESEGGKTLTKAESMEEMKKGLAMGKTTACKFNILSTKVKGETAIAMTSGHFAMTTKA
ncbi:MAG: hypothetical protein ACHQ50_02125, partial [Fimbriimonadales bacterium]